MKIVIAAAVAALLSGCATPTITSTSASRSALWTTTTTEAPIGTPGQTQAVRKATSYLRSQAFSRQGLLGQLAYEGFGASDAEFAVAYLESQGAVDWNDQALKKARSYLRSQSFSLPGLVDQLEYEKFTPAQAQYGATKAYGA